MRILLLLILVHALFLSAQAQVTENYKVIDLSKDDLVHADSVRLTVSFSDTKGQTVRGDIEISIGAKTFRPTIDSFGMVRLLLHRRLLGKPIHFFSRTGYDLRTEPMDWESGNSLTMVVQFEPLPVRIDVRPVAEKPVIYLYPERSMQVSVRVGFSGEFLFTYPQYGDGWDVMAHPSGEIDADGRKYRYLFWEGSMDAAHVPLDLSKGFVIGRDELVDFFERTLGTIGLSDIEVGDFITHWVPRMMGHERVFMHFLLDKEYDALSTLDIRPVPDQVIRLFMFWKGIAPNERPQPRAQELPSFKREGFTVVEWGGAELDAMSKEAN